MKPAQMGCMRGEDASMPSNVVKRQRTAFDKAQRDSVTQEHGTLVLLVQSEFLGSWHSLRSGKNDKYELATEE